MRKLFVMALLTVGFAMNVQADDRHHEGPCAKDREKLCANVEKGEGRVMKCLKDNADKLSPECKAHREEMKASMKKMKESCHADAEKLCGDKKAGHGEKMRCMKENKEKLSHACQERMKAMKDHKHEEKK